MDSEPGMSLLSSLLLPEGSLQESVGASDWSRSDSHSYVVEFPRQEGSRAAGQSQKVTDDKPYSAVILLESYCQIVL